MFRTTSKATSKTAFRTTLAVALLASSTLLAACASDPVALAQSVKVLNQGCESAVEVSLAKGQPSDGSLKVSRTCAPAATAPSKP